MDFKKPELNKDYMTYRELSKMFSLNILTIHRIIQRHQIKKIWEKKPEGVGGHGRWLVDTKSFIDYINKLNK